MDRYFWDNLGNTKITRRGLLALCRLNLTELGISDITSNVDENSYGDEGAVTIARHLYDLRSLSADNNNLCWEGLTAVTSCLIKLNDLLINFNRGVMRGASSLGKLPQLERLYAGTGEYSQGTLS